MKKYIITILCIICLTVGVVVDLVRDNIDVFTVTGSFGVGICICNIVATYITNLYETKVQALTTMLSLYNSDYLKFKESRNDQTN